MYRQLVLDGLVSDQHLQDQLDLLLEDEVLVVLQDLLRVLDQDLVPEAVLALLALLLQLLEQLRVVLLLAFDVQVLQVHVGPLPRRDALLGDAFQLRLHDVVLQHLPDPPPLLHRLVAPQLRHLLHSFVFLQ